MRTSLNKTSLKPVIFVSLGYFLVAELSLILSTNNISTAIVWSAAGFAFAMILHFGVKIWPAIAIGSLLANTHYLLGRDPTLLSLLIANICIAIGNVIGPILGTYLIKRVVNVQFDFSKQKSVLAFAALGVIPTSAIAALFGALALYVSSLETLDKFFINWHQWGVSDLVGTLVITPAVLLWLQDKSFRLNLKRAVEVSVITLLIISLAIAIFGHLNEYMNHSLVRPFLLILPLIWGAMRFGPRAIATWNVLAFTILWLGTSYGFGHYNRELLPQPLVPVQLFLGIVGFTILLLSSGIQELRQARTALMDTNLNLERRVLERTRNLHESEQRLQEAKDKAENATKLKDKFVLIVSHDLKSPFMGITGLASVIAESCSACENKEIKEFATLIKSTSEKMQDMVCTLLDIGRLQSGKLQPEKEFVYIRNLASNQFDILSYIANNKGVVLKNNLPDNTVFFADPTLLGGVLRNILLNAIKFCKKDDTVTIYLPNNNSSIIAIKDTGTGIMESVLPHLFTHEIKTVRTGTDGESGTGLGLPYCHDIMVAHGGALTAESVEGEGSTFYIQMPTVKPVIVVVDYQKKYRDITKKHLEVIIDSELIEAETSDDIFSISSNVTLNLIIAGINIPETNGLELLENLKTDPKTSKIPVIMVSNSEKQDDIKDKAFILGANAFINLPHDTKDFSTEVKKYFC